MPGTSCLVLAPLTFCPVAICESVPGTRTIFELTVGEQEVAICESVPGTRVITAGISVRRISCNMRECAGYEMNQSTFDEHIDGCNMRECAGYEYRHIYVIRHADTVAICESVPGTRDFTIAIALPV